MKIAFRVDGSVTIGTGHFARCLTLAAALRSCGGKAHFVCRHITDFMRAQLAEMDFGLSLLPPRQEPFNSNLAHAAWLGVSQEGDAADTIAAMTGKAPWDWLVVDHYGLDIGWESRLRTVTKNILAIDDLADRVHDSNVLLDQNLQTGGRYHGLVPESCKLMLGPEFALLRPEFCALRDAGRQTSKEPRINIFFGGTDPKGMTLMALGALQNLSDSPFLVDVIVGADNPRHGAISALCEELPNATIHYQAGNMAELFSRAHLALGAGGATSWERCCLGLPAVIVSIADNQKGGCRALAMVRAALYLGDITQLTTDCMTMAIEGLLKRPRLLAAISRRAAALVDGQGAHRVVEAMLCA